MSVSSKKGGKLFAALLITKTGKVSKILDHTVIDGTTQNEYDWFKGVINSFISNNSRIVLIDDTIKSNKYLFKTYNKDVYGYYYLDTKNGLLAKKMFFTDSRLDIEKGYSVVLSWCAFNLMI